jgi:hypothetical protein
MSQPQKQTLSSTFKNIAQQMADELTAIEGVEDLHVLVNHGRGVRREVEELRMLCLELGDTLLEDPVAAAAFSGDLDAALEQVELSQGQVTTMEEMRARLSIALMLGTEVANDLREQYLGGT